MSLRFVALIAVALAPVAASAATVSPIGGEVRVSTGQGFQKIVAAAEFAPGAQVMVSPRRVCHYYLRERLRSYR